MSCTPFNTSIKYFFKQVVGNSLKSLEVSEEKANQRVEEFKREMKTLTVRLKEAENRAESAEKQVKRLQKEVDRLEGNYRQRWHTIHLLAFVNDNILIGNCASLMAKQMVKMTVNGCS